MISDESAHVAAVLVKTASLPSYADNLLDRPLPEILAAEISRTELTYGSLRLPPLTECT